MIDTYPHPTMPDRSIVDLGERHSVTYRSGARKTFRYVTVFVIHYASGDEPAWVPCRRAGDELYLYPLEPHGLGCEASAAMYAVTGLPDPWHTEARQ